MITEKTTTILIVDDEPYITAVCCCSLARRGFNPIVADDGEAGLRAFTERQSEIALVVADLQMPKITGIEMVRRIFAISAHAKIILTSGHPLDLVPGDLQRVCGMLPKPFSAQRLIAAVEERLETGKPDACSSGARVRCP